ncbi:MAG: sodium:solute symporter [Candidatus Omnitrophica bacterium]|nr:sodium:solute symporter [Candidatus Omnitrophota bacterium]
MLTPADHLALADWLIIGGYIAGIILMGARLGRGQKDTRDYFLGSRNVSWWGVGLSILATETSALSFLAVPALAYATDLAFIQIIFGYVIARIGLAMAVVPFYFRGEIYSPYQLLTKSFGPAAGRLGGGFFLLSGVLAAGVRVYVTCIPIQLMLGLQILPAILLFVGLSLVYTYVGGIKAVIWTDVVQFVLFMAGALFTLGYIAQATNGGLAGALEQAAAAGKLHWFNPSFSWTMPFNLWMGLLGGTAQVMSSHGADQLIVQRVLTCRSVADGRKALVLSAVIILPLFLVFLLTGTLLWAYYQQFQLAIPLPKSQAGFAQNDYIYPIFILTVIPSVFKGLLVVAILAAAMSSVSSALSALASVSSMDFCRGLFWPGRTERFYFRMSRFATVFWALLLVLVAYASRQATTVLNWAFSLNGLTSGALLGAVLLALGTKPGRARPLVFGMIISLAAMIGIDGWGKDLVAWPWYTLIGTCITVVVTWFMRPWHRSARGERPVNRNTCGDR